MPTRISGDTLVFLKSSDLILKKFERPMGNLNILLEQGEQNSANGLYGYVQFW